jgi:antitoxin HicB
MTKTTTPTNAYYYEMVIQWSDEDEAFLVSFPEWADYLEQPVTHGATYQEAARKGERVLENLIATAQHEGDPLPTPLVRHASHVAS